MKAIPQTLHRAGTRGAALLLAALMVLLPGVGCRGNARNKNDAPPVTLTVMSWNDDFRQALETYFIPRHPELMANVTIQWENCEIVDYEKAINQRLLGGEALDLFVGNDDMAPAFSRNPAVAPLAQIGITADALAHQYPYTRTLGADEAGVQRGSAMNLEPGILLYRADYAADYLGITDPAVMRQRLSTWDGFLSVAQELHERSQGSVKMLSDSSEIWRAIDSEMTGQWLTDGRLSASDETLGQWLDYVKNLNQVSGFAGIKPMDDDWGKAVRENVFCFFAAPWLCKSASPVNADINTIFSAASRGGNAFGHFRTAPAPCAFTYGGNWLYCPAHSAHKELVGQIIRAFTCDKDFMRLLALGQMTFVNHTDVIDELSDLSIANPLLEGEDAFSVYRDAARAAHTLPSPYDKRLSALLYPQARTYAQGKLTQVKALYQFRSNVWKQYETLLEEPKKP